MFQPIDGAEHQPIEDRATDERGGWSRLYSVPDLDDGVSRDSAVIEHEVGAFKESLAAGMLRRRDAGHCHAGEGDDGEAFLFRVERHVDRRPIFAGVRNYDNRLAGLELILAIVAFDELCPITREIFDEAARGIDDSGYADQAAGTADDFARDQFAMSAAEGVDHSAARDNITEHRRERGQRGCVGFPRGGEQFVGGTEIRFRERRHPTFQRETAPPGKSKHEGFECMVSFVFLSPDIFANVAVGMFPRIPALGAAVLALCVCVRGADLIPIEDFARRPLFSQMQLSPDGEYLGFVREIDGVGQMFFSDLRTMKATGLNLGEERDLHGHRNVSGFDWIGPTRVVVRTMFSDGYAGGWFATDRDLSAGKHLGNEGSFRLTRIVHRFYNDRDILALTPRTDLGRERFPFPDVVKLNTRMAAGSTVVRNPGNVIHWLADRKGRVRAGVARKDDTLSILYREDEKSKWRTTASFHKDTSVRPLAFAENEAHLYVAALSPNKRMALYRYDPAKDQLGELLWDDAEYDLGGAITGIETGRLFGVSYFAADPRVKWLNARSEEIQATIDAALPGVVNTFVNMAHDEKRFLFRSSSDRQPAIYYVFDVEKQELREVGKSRPWIKPETMAEMYPISFAARDGLKIRGYLTVPPNQPRRDLPVVVMPHGRAWERDVWGFDPMIHMLANRGYAVLQINYRGSQGFGLEFERSGRREIGGKVQEDIEDGVRWAIAKKVADPARIAIFGHSFGGYSTLFALGQSPDLYCCGILFAGIVDWFDMFKELDELEYEFARRHWVEVIGDPEDDEQRLKEISPITFADRIAAPVLIIQGKGDRIVPARQSRKMIAALERAGRKPETLFFEREGHDIRHEKERIEYFKAVEAFLAKHMRKR